MYYADPRPNLTVLSVKGLRLRSLNSGRLLKTQFMCTQLVTMYDKYVRRNMGVRTENQNERYA